MSKVALRLQDVRLASRAVGDCRDVGHDTGQWQALAMQAVGRLVGAAAVTGGEGHWRRPPEPLAPVSTYSIGLDDSAQALLLAYVREVGVNADPIFLKLQRRSGRLETVRRGDVVSNRDWYQAATFIDFCRPASLDHSLTSIYRRPSSDAMSCIRLHRERGDRDFSERERALTRFFHDELGRLIGGPLASVLDSDAQSLSPRLQETLSFLLEGDSEKQVALRMKLSRTTVHQYVTMLYRRFGVQSRAELLTTVFRRRNRP